MGQTILAKTDDKGQHKQIKSERRSDLPLMLLVYLHFLHQSCTKTYAKIGLVLMLRLSAIREKKKHHS
jgi:hypothetical protein